MSWPPSPSKEIEVVSKNTSWRSVKRSRRWANNCSSMRSLVQRGANGDLPACWSSGNSSPSEAMEHGEEDGPLDVELEAASLQQLLDDPLTAGLLPEPLEDENRPDALSGDRGELS